MATLHRLISVGGETPGFLIPIFKTIQGANHELLQRIDQHNHIASLEPILSNNVGSVYVKEEFEVRIGGHALWAFRDEGGQVHIGDAERMQAIGRRILKSGSLKLFPMAAAELVTFCKAEHEYPHVLLSAFKSIEKLSKLGAEVWRDAVILRPLIIKDLDGENGASLYEGPRFNDLTVVSRNNVSHIYSSVPISPTEPTLPLWRRTALIFGIAAFRTHLFSNQRKKSAIVNPTWCVLGIGGVARFVIERPPFKGNRTDFDAPYNGAIVRGSSRQEIPNDSYPNRLLVAIVMSDSKHVHAINQTVRAIATEGVSRHAINIRPIGFGTSRKGKASPAMIRKELDNFDCVWIIANHRQRQTGSYANSLSVVNQISRLVKNVTVALIQSLNSQEGRNLLAEAEYKKGFGLFGAVRYNASLDLHESIRSVLLSMICEDAHLHSASKIQILWPYYMSAERQIEHVSLGAHDYKVEISSRSSTSKSPYIVGFATNVLISVATKQDFFDFCISILAGYGWNMQYEAGNHIIFESDDNKIRVWPVVSIDAAQSAIWQIENGEDSTNDLIVTNQTIPSQLRLEANLKSRSLIHYSELGRWMKTERHQAI